MSIMGIDPGQSGGVAVISPTLVEAVGFTNLTETDIYDVIVKLSTGVDACYIESVHSMPAQGVASSFKFGKNYGFLRACIMSCGIPMIDVTPQKWQKALGCMTKGDKNITKARAQQWFPSVKVTHAIADAILIAEYGRRMVNEVRFV